MPISQENFNKALFDLLKTQGYNPEPLDSKGKTAPVPNEADVFKISIGDTEHAYVTIDDAQQLKVYYDDSLVEETDNDKFRTLPRQLKKWAQRKQLGFELVNRDHLQPDMAMREHMKQKKQLGEGYYPMGKKASYSDSVPQVKILLQHTRQIEEGEQRFRNIAKIFVENVNGERFLLPTTRPGLARVYARHIAEGGTPYDEKGSHITSLVEEYTKMAGFVRATRNGQFNESAQRLVNEGLSHYEKLRETLSKLTSRRGYNSYFESYTPILNEVTDEATSLNDLFVQETLDPRIENVLPILNRLSKNISEMREVKELDEWAQSVLEVEDETTKTLAEPASEMLDEAPGAETLAHNDRTEKQNLKAFDLEEGDMEETVTPSADMMKKIKKKFNKIEEKKEDEVYDVKLNGKTIGVWHPKKGFMSDNPNKIPSSVDKPAGSEIDYAGGPLGKKAKHHSGPMGVVEGENKTYHYIVVDGKKKFKTTDHKRAKEMADEMKNQPEFQGKNISIQSSVEYQPTVNEEELNEIGKLGKLAATAGLAAAGIGGEHMAKMPNLDQLQNQPGFAYELTQNLAKDPKYRESMQTYYDALNDPETSPMRKKLANQYNSDQYFRVWMDTIDQAKAKQPTMWNKIKNFVKSAFGEGVAEGTKTGNPVILKGCDFEDVVNWLVKNVGPVTKKSSNYYNGWQGKGWILNLLQSSNEDGIPNLELSADTKLTNNQVLAKTIQMACSNQQGVEEGLDANQKRVGQLGPTEPVGKNEKNLRGMAVGASESVELDAIKTLSGIK